MNSRWWRQTAGRAVSKVFAATGRRSSSRAYSRQDPCGVSEGSDGDTARSLVADGGEDIETDADSDEPSTENDETGSGDDSNVEVTEAGGADPADPKWEKPDLDDVPEFETGATEPLARASDEASDDRAHEHRTAEDPTSGMPNDARSPGNSRIRREGAEGYIAALELCTRLPEDIRLPEEAADLVPAAVEAELEQDVQSFAAAEFDNPSPHVDVLEFVERADELWLRLRLGIPPEAFADLDPEEVRAHALQELDGIL